MWLTPHQRDSQPEGERDNYLYICLKYLQLQVTVYHPLPARIYERRLIHMAGRL